MQKQFSRDKMKQKLCILAVLLLVPLLLTGCESGEIESSALFEETSNYNSGMTDLSSGELQLNNNVVLSESELYYQNKYTVTDNNYITRNAEWIFYIHGNGSIMRMREDGREQTPIIKEMKCSSVFLLGEVLYFLSDIDSSIYACDLDGERITDVIAGNVSWFTISDKFIYYLDESSHLHKSTLDGTQQSQITDFETENVCITEDKIIYFNSSESAIYITSLEGESLEIISFDTEYPPLPFSVYKNRLYYVEENISDNFVVGCYIYSLNLTSMESKILFEGSWNCSRELAFWEDYLIYNDYSESDNGQFFYAYSFETGSSVVIAEDNLGNPIVLGEYVYYQGYYKSGADIACVNMNTLENATIVAEPDFDELIYTDEYLFFRKRKDLNIYRTEPDGSNLYRLTDAECDSLYHHNDKLYYGGYANGYNSEFSDTASEVEAYGFFELDKEGQGSVLIKEDEAFPDFLHEGYAYRSGFGSEASIYRFSLDEIEDVSEDKPFIKENDGSLIQGSHLIIDEWIYVSYVNPSRKDLIGLIKMRLDGSEKQKVLNEFIDQAQWHDGKIYYTGLYSAAHEAGINDMQLWRMNPDGTENEMLLQLDSVIEKYEIADGAVYYLDSEYDYIYKFDLSSREKTQLTDVPCTDFTVSNGGIYFSNAYDRGAIYLMSKDGEFPHKIIDPDDEWRDLSDYQVTGLK